MMASRKNSFFSAFFALKCNYFRTVRRCEKLRCEQMWLGIEVLSKSDGTATMMTHSKVVTQIKELAPERKITHRFILHDSQTMKKISADLHSVLTDTVKTINYIKSSAFKIVHFMV